MDSLLANPAFRTYALCSAILVLKMLASAVYTGTRRQQTQGFVNPEDAARFGAGGVAAVEAETPAVAHALRIQRNDLENIPLFFAIGLLYVLSGGGAFWTAVWCWTFTLARLAHTWFYVNRRQPGRAIAFAIGTVAVVSMSIAVLVRAL